MLNIRQQESNMSFDFINSLRDEAVNRFHVDPAIFIVIYLLTIPPNWYSTFLMVRSAYRCYKGNKRIPINDLISKPDFITGFVLCVLTLVAPYVYVLIYGSNLPVWFYIYLVMLAVLMPYLIIRKVRKKAVAKKFTYKIADEDETLEGLKLVNRRYCEKGYLPESELGKAFEDKYIKHSMYIVAKADDTVTGVIRIVENSEDGLPVLNEFTLFESEREQLRKYPRGSLVELGNLAAEPGQGIASGLYKAAYRYCIKNQKMPLAAMDEGLMNKLIGKYWFSRFAYRRLGDTIFYIGGRTVPIFLKPKRIFLLFL